MSWCIGAIVSVLSLAFFSASAFAQLPIANIQPDAVASGMTIALEIMARTSDSGAFGKDGLEVAGTRVEFLDPADTNRIILGPTVTSWNGRLIQVAVIVLPTAGTGLDTWRRNVFSTHRH